MCACGRWAPEREREKEREKEREREREATVEKIPTLQAKGNTEAKFVIFN